MDGDGDNGPIVIFGDEQEKQIKEKHEEEISFLHVIIKPDMDLEHAIYTLFWFSLNTCYFWGD